MSIILQSKMNNHTNVNYPGQYREAFKHIESHYAPDVWYKFINIPEHISFALIDILDRGFKSNFEVYFDEFFESFKFIKNDS